MIQNLPASQVICKTGKHNTETKSPSVAINIRGFTHFCVLPLGADQVLIVKSREKSSVLLTGGEKQESSEIHQSTVFFKMSAIRCHFTRAYPAEVNQNFIDLGEEKTQLLAPLGFHVEEGIYLTPAHFTHPVPMKGGQKLRSMWEVHNSVTKRLRPTFKTIKHYNFLHPHLATKGLITYSSFYSVHHVRC